MRKHKKPDDTLIDGDAVCPSCGAKTSVGMKYCGRCGANMMEES